MAACELLRGCIFFNDQMADMPSTAEIIKFKYCQNDNSDCARYLVFQAKGKGNVPQNLFPNQTDNARRIIAG